MFIFYKYKIKYNFFSNIHIYELIKFKRKLKHVYKLINKMLEK